MCARYEVDASVDEILREIEFFRLQPPPRREDLTWAKQIRPYGKGPVLVREGLKLMQFALVPSWSKEKRVKFSTYNARLDGVLEKPTWRRPFSEKHCLVPVSNFIEPIYQGEFAGNWVRFQEPTKKLLFAAGIWDEWRSPVDGEVIESFAILTHDPLKPVEEMGHERSPLFLDEVGCGEWLALGEGPSDRVKRSPLQWVDFLRSHRLTPAIAALKDEPMKAGWEKRKT